MALPVRDFIIQRLLEFDPNFDTGAGVPTTSLLIDPLSIVLQPIVNELTALQATQSVLTVLEADDPDAFPEDIVDGLASNVFVDRNQGEIGSDVMRLRFFEPQAYSSQQGVLIFRGSTGQRFTNSEPVSITEAEMALNQEGTLFYVDVPVVAVEEGEDFNVLAGDITTMEAEPVGVANVTNRFGVTNGRDRETNTELLDRVKVAVAVRALVTGRGIIVTLTETFTSIEEVQPVGFGDPEMMRDIIYNVHVGGNVDVYVKTPGWVSSSSDFIGVVPDYTRQAQAGVTVVALEQDVGYSLQLFPVDRTERSPVVSAIDQLFFYADGVDFTIDDVTGLFFRIAGSRIFHFDGLGASATGPKTLISAGDFADVRPGMTLTVKSPGSIAGTYTVKDRPDANTIIIYSEFPGSSFPVGSVVYAIDEVLAVSFDYNPVTVDIVASPRDGRDLVTITDVPLMFVESIETLDPLSLEPTGTILDGGGGYGWGGYGLGGYGIGAGADYRLVVGEPTLRHSSREDNYIEFSSGLVGTSFRISYEYAAPVPPIQAFVDDPSERNLAASLLVRHFIPVFVDATEEIVYDFPAADEASGVTNDEMTEIVKDFITDVDAGNQLELSDIVDVMYDNGAVRVDLGTLQSLRGEIHNHDGSIEFAALDGVGNLEIPSAPIPDPTDKPLSTRIARFRGRNIVLQRNVV